MTRQWSNRVIVTLVVTFAGCVKQPSGASDSGTGAAVPQSAASPSARSTAADSSRLVELRTDRPTYRAGDPVTMTIVNHTSQSWAFNPCTRIIERQTGGTWEAMPDARRCIMIAAILNPGATTSATSSFDSSLDAGTYRVVIAFSGDGPPPGRQTTAASVPVTITK